MHCSCAVSKLEQLSAVVSPYVSRLISLTKPSGDSGWSGWFRASSSGALLNRNSIGDSGEPCGTPACSWCCSTSVNYIIVE
jgi:hypothetical protein